MANQQIIDYLAKHIKPEDGFIIRAAKCIGAFMEHGPIFVEDEGIVMETKVVDKGKEYEHIAVMIETDAFEFLDVLLESYINSVEPFGDGSTDISVDHADEDLRYLCRVYEREKAKGLDTAYVSMTFFINRNSSSITIDTGSEFKFTVGNLNWIGSLFATA